MNKWRELSAGRELDRVVAERLGWRSVRYVAGEWELVTPDGIEMGLGRSDAEVWTHPDLPRYSGDLNAAIDLLKQMSMHTIGSLYFDETFEETGLWTCNVFMDGPGDIANGQADTPALAICRAWLSWSDTKDSLS